jgi:predicted transcriptional regulator
MAFTVRTDDELERALSELSESEGASRQEIVRRAVLDRYERSAHRERVDRATTEMMAQWGDVIERLASA